VMAGWVTLSLMLIRMARRGIYRLSPSVLRRLAAQLAAALLMAWALIYAATIITPPSDLLALSLWLVGFISSGLVVYGLAALALGAVKRADISLLRGRR